MADEADYNSPEVDDLGTLSEMTLAGQLTGSEDAGPKFVILDVSAVAGP